MQQRDHPLADIGRGAAVAWLAKPAAFLTVGHWHLLSTAAAAIVMAAALADYLVQAAALFIATAQTALIECALDQAFEKLDCLVEAEPLDCLDAISDVAEVRTAVITVAVPIEPVIAIPALVAFSSFSFFRHITLLRAVGQNCCAVFP